jgi:hypothetical protein
MRISFLLLTLAVTSAEAQRKPLGVYFQVAGEGMGISTNLEVGVTQSMRLRAGLGWIWIAGTTPFTVSYLISRKNSTFEVGGGATVMYFIPDRKGDEGTIYDFFEKRFFGLGQGTKVIPMGILGWRYHPRDGAILRATLNPLLYEGAPHLIGGLSLGFPF